MNTAEVEKALRKIVFGIVCDTGITTEQKVDRIVAARLSGMLSDMERVKALCRRMYDTSPQPCADCPIGEAYCPYSNEPMHWDVPEIQAAIHAALQKEEGEG